MVTWAARSRSTIVIMNNPPRKARTEYQKSRIPGPLFPKQPSIILFGLTMVFLAATFASASGNNEPEIYAESTFPDSDDTPIVLVHGFAGWGRNDIPGFLYWGGFRDIEAELNTLGYDVHTASVGPFSSTWDRACELYAYINGGRVDYGAAHATRFGHARFGPEYPGIYPEWDEEHRIHIIAHSMGGTTARLLAYLLRHGSEDERELSGKECNPLFLGGDQRIRSITTISTPHNGTTIVNDVTLIDTIMRAAIASIATVLENETFLEFDLKLGQWGIRRNEKEPLDDYFNRLRGNEVWSAEQRDFSLYDVSIDGTAALNRLTAAEPDVYYFSWANEKTNSRGLLGYYVPELSMITPFVPSGIFLGSLDVSANDETGPEWRENDGVVNTASMKGPFIDSDDIIVPYDGTPEPGVWNYMGLIQSTDHAGVLGIPDWKLDKSSGSTSILGFYRGLCENALSLER